MIPILADASFGPFQGLIGGSVVMVLLMSVVIIPSMTTADYLVRTYAPNLGPFWSEVIVCVVTFGVLMGLIFGLGRFLPKPTPEEKPKKPEP